MKINRTPPKTQKIVLLESERSITNSGNLYLRKAFFVLATQNQ